MIKIKFCGAAHTVTGSNYVVYTDNGNFVVDCGMFQGPDVEPRNLDDFQYDPKEMDFAILTHSHIDHSGMLPKLVNRGFDAPIYATSHTVQITTELLLDSAKIQEGNFKQGKNFGKYTKTKALIYDMNDANKTIDLFRVKHFDEGFTPIEGINIKFVLAGHILGAASIEVDILDDGKWKKIVFSGDIGREHATIIPSFDISHKATPDYVLIESLYGGQYHPDRNESVQELISAIKTTVDRGGSVFIPCFAVERTQEILNDLRLAKQSGALSNDLPVWLDSPLAQRVTRIYRDALQHGEVSLFDFENLRYVNKYKTSQSLTTKPGQVILAGSGMADGGRIVSHLTRALENSNNSVIFVGFQAEGTLGRELTEGAKSVTIDGLGVNVKAQIHHLKGFSAHGDTTDYVKWIERYKNDGLKKVFLVHAEVERAEALKTILTQEGYKDLEIPDMFDEMVLG